MADGKPENKFAFNGEFKDAQFAHQEKKSNLKKSSFSYSSWMPKKCQKSRQVAIVVFFRIFGDFCLEGGGNVPQNSIKPMRSYIVKDNQIGLAVSEILRYRVTHIHRNPDTLL